MGNVNLLADNQVDETTENRPLIFGQGFGGITDLQVGPDGYLYVLSYTGALYRIVPLSESNTPKNQPALAAQNETQSANSIPNFSEFKNFNAVAPIVVTHTNFGSVYLLFPKVTSSSTDVIPRPSKSWSK